MKKNPVMVAAGKKAWATRRANGDVHKKEESPKLEILTSDDPTLGGVIKIITNRYNSMEVHDRADYLSRLYKSLDYIEDRLADDEN